MMRCVYPCFEQISLMIWMQWKISREVRILTLLLQLREIF
uniref:Uncharacterized protein n=1 Tax=Arundo donax TaxID=35708 RepID=A0A0A9BA11_ARUDO